MRQVFNQLILVVFVFFLVPTQLFAQPTSVDFVGSSLSGCSPLVVSFTDLSTGSGACDGTTTTGLCYRWSFGNGNTSTLQNPSTTYFTPGDYTVTLSIYNTTDTITETKLMYITVFNGPTAGIGATGATDGCTPITVDFNDLSVPSPDTTIATWLWDFGDGVTSTLQNPTHTYTVPGSYNVSLQIIDENGCFDTLTVSNFVNASTPPAPSFTVAPPVGCVPPLLVNFTNTTTGGAAPLTYEWDFGDGSAVSTATDPTHSYTTSGSFDVQLIATDVFGCPDSVTIPGSISIGTVVADFTPSATSVCEGSSITFTNTTTGGADTYNWDFGDGGSSTATNPTYTYTTAGTYTLTLTASQSGGGLCVDDTISTNLITVLPSPTADFSGAPLVGCEVLHTVNFTDLSVGATAWSWTFGDGGTSTLQNPSYDYAAPGNYNVSLTVTNAAGCTDVITFPNYVNIVLPVAGLNGVPTDGCVPLTVDFTDVSFSVQTIVSWAWDFGDGSVSALENPTHIYTVPGTYTVTLTITNILGCTDVVTIPGYINVGVVPVADFTAFPDTVCFSEIVTFTNTSTGATGYFWDFGDGVGTSGAVNPTYVYPDTGCFDVMLTADNMGCVDDTTIVGVVCVQAPIADFTMDAPVGCDTPHTVNFDTTGTAITGPIDVFEWDFGDGSPLLSGPTANPTHIYANTGVFTVQLVVFNTPAGCSDTITDIVTISHPEADFNNSGTLLRCAPFPEAFTNLSTGVAPVSSFWTFGDGASSSATNPTHIYSTPGVYDVELTVTDVNGCTDTETALASITIFGPTPGFTADTLTGCGSLTVEFTDTSSTFGGAAIVNHSWNFGDGTIAAGNLPTFTHTYTAAGTYTVSLTVTDGNGCSRTRVTNNYIRITDPTAAFTLSDTIGCVDVVTFSTTNSSVATPGSFLTYEWDFGDGFTSTGFAPSHIYTANGVYDVQLIVTDDNGCQDSTTLVAAIEVTDVLAGFTSDVATGICPPLLVGFTDTSSYRIVSWDWDFGDGVTAVVQNPSHNYTTAGSFDVTLSVINDQGCVDTAFIPGFIDIAGPFGTFTFDADSGCIPMPVEFYASGTGVASYIWDFGDGNVIVGPDDTVMHIYTSQGPKIPNLILDDGLGCTFPVIGTDTIYVDSIPEVDFTADNRLFCGGSGTVNFTDLSFSYTPILSWSWDFGDGNTSTLQNPSHTYAAPGLYTVTLSVINEFTCTDTLVRTSYITVGDNPNPGFDVSGDFVCPPVNIDFTDTSSVGTYPIVAWNWDFGGLGTSTLQNPTQAFTTDGVYTIQLIVTDSIGCQDSITRDVTILLKPTADFLPIDTIGCSYDSIPFIDLSAGTPTAWTWILGDGDTSFVQNPTHLYPDTGTYSVSLEIENGVGCRDTLTRPNMIQLTRPYADFTVDTSIGCRPFPVTFTDASFSDTTLTNWDWDFGDGATGATVLPTISYTYTDTGFFTVTMRVTDAVGCMDSITKVDTIVVPEPEGVFTFLPDTGCIPQDIAFTAVTDDVDTWAWDFGDGTPVVFDDDNVTHTYAVAGTYNPQLLLTDTLGCTFLVTTPDSIWVDTLPIVDFTVDTTVLCGSGTVNFTDLSTSPQPIISWAWDFGDGGTSTLQNPAYTYTTPGTYAVKLVVTHEYGCADSLIRPAYIIVDPPPVAGFATSDTISCPPVNIAFTDTSTSTFSIVTWEWDFDDGSTSGLPSPNHIYNTTGLYMVELIVTDLLGCKDTANQNIQILPKPVADFTPVDTQACSYDAIPVRDLSTGTPVFWTWILGDGDTSFVQHPNHLYPDTGLYTVSLEIENAVGCRDTMTRVNTIDLIRPFADFTIDTSIFCRPFPVTFTDISLSDSPVVGWEWVFGDGDTSLVGPVETHTYADTGAFNVMLVVTDGIGCIDTLIQNGLIDVPEPDGTFSFVPDTGCVEQNVDFTAITSDAVVWTWDFGDGTPVVSDDTLVSHIYTFSGNFVPTLLLEDTLGCQLLLTSPDTIVVDSLPTADFTVDTTVICGPGTVNFTDLSTSPRVITDWLWTFGDGTTSTLQNPSHAYAAPGVYTVKLLVTHELGCQDSLTRTSYIIVDGPLIAGFDASDTIVCPPVNILFTDTSTFAFPIFTWEWSFGDGSTSSATNPTHNYGVAGLYNVEMIITDALGCKDTADRFVTILPKPVADFGPADTVACSYDSIAFTDLSTGGPALWTWTFGDGDTSFVQNPIHYFPDTGSYTIMLEIENAVGCRDTMVRPNSIRLLRPYADFTVDTAIGCRPFNVLFSDASFGDTTLVNWEWDFGDGATGTSATPTIPYTYTDTGFFSVEMVVTDALGCMDSITKVDTIAVPEPDGIFSFVPDTGCVEQLVDFTAITDGAVLWTWDFGDGTPPVSDDTLVQHTYTFSGHFNPSLLLEDTLGCQLLLTTPDSIVVDSLPVVDFTVDNTILCGGGTVNFTDLTVTPRPIISWLWDFGDGTTSPLQNPSHTYAAPGIYDVKLVVVHELGCTDSLTRLEYIYAVQPPVAGFDASDTMVCPPVNIFFTDTSSVDSFPLITWAWDFGDGTTSAIPSPSHAYTVDGIYTVSLTVTDDKGCTDVASRDIEILLKPTADFAPTDTVACSYDSLSFTDLSLGTPTAWTWLFGDGDSAFVQNPTHLFPDTGSYSMTLMVQNGVGCRDTISYPNTIRLFRPFADFTLDTSIGCRPFPILFTDASVSDTTLVNWDWDFGDGTVTSTAVPSISHTYLDTGFFSVQMIVTDELGCVDSITKTDSIAIPEPEGTFTFVPDTGCVPQNVDFIAITDGAVVWTWNFGDGTPTVSDDTLVSHIYAFDGTFNPSLLLEDTLGCTFLVTTPDSVYIDSLPVVDFTVDTTVLCGGGTVTFSDLTTSPQPIVSWDWDFGDGVTSALQNPSHTYAAPGIYTVKLVVTHLYGCTDSLEKVEYIYAVQPPLAGFSPSDTVVCPPINILFTDTSSVDSFALSTWAWDFGDGTTSAIQNPTHAYTVDGIYTIQLTVTDIFGCIDSTDRDIEILLKPTADFLPTDTVACSYDSIPFTDLSTGGVTNWTWLFGDGDSAFVQNPSHLYPDTGSFTVTLEIENGVGCRDTITKLNTIRVHRPFADFTLDTTTGCFPFPVTFTDITTSDSAIVAWSWDFGDGNISSIGPVVTNVYGDTGRFNVTLTVTDSDGCIDAITQSGLIDVPQPEGSFIVIPDTGCVPQNVDFIATTVDAVTWTWDFGDGTAPVVDDTLVSHVYTFSGNFAPTLTLTDTLGCSVLVTIPDSIVIDSIPTAAFTVDTTQICGRGDVTFTDLSTSPRVIVAWEWHFGDGDSAFVQNPTHTYITAGVYDVTLIVTHELGCMDTLIIPNYIEVVQLPSAAYTVSDTLSCPPVNLIFLDASTFTVYPIVSWEWDFGDGGIDSTPNTSHNYAVDGTFLSSLVVTNTLGCTDTALQNILIYEKPVAEFDLVDSLGCSYDSVSFTDLSTGAVIEWNWDFGDGTTSTDQNPTHLFPGTGLFTVTLDVLTSDGCRDTIVKTDVVQRFKPVVAIMDGFDDACMPLEATFMDLSTSDTTITGWDWDFGDGAVSTTGPLVVHTYPGPGTYVYTFIVTDAMGCQDTLIDSLTSIERILPPPQLYVATVESDVSDSISFTAYVGDDFDRYRVFREIPPLSGTFVGVGDIFTQEDTFFVETGLANLTQSYCYRVQAIDTCGRVSDLDSSRTHCTIELQAAPGPDAVLLSWNAYVGWDSIAAYEIYKVTDYTTPTSLPIGIVAGNVLSFTDTNATCYELNCYRIRAIDFSGLALESWSDTACATPIHFAPTEPMTMVHATVEFNRDVLVEWLPVTIDDPELIYLERSADEGLSFITLATLPPDQTAYLDTDVDVQSISYTYRVSVLDSCGDVTPLSLISKSILLAVDNATGNPILDWSAYQDWLFGVDEYAIEIQNTSIGSWSELARVSGAELTYTDENTIFEVDEFCYRIRGFENGGNTSFSLSNEICVPPVVWIPNTISPNGDGANDFFVVPSIHHYPDNELLIFNRWGNEIYRKQGYLNDWGGTNGRSGAKLPDGTYYYVLKLNAVDKEFAGYIMIYR